MTPMLQRMLEANLFSIRPKGANFRIVEECDNHFEELVTADELRQLGQEIIALADAAP